VAALDLADTKIKTYFFENTHIYLIVTAWASKMVALNNIEKFIFPYKREFIY